MLRKLIKLNHHCVVYNKIFYSASDAWKKFATLDPWAISGSQPGKAQNLGSPRKKIKIIKHYIFLSIFI
jgi:hypothetical protein